MVCARTRESAGLPGLAPCTAWLLDGLRVAVPPLSALRGPNAYFVGGDTLVEVCCASFPSPSPAPAFAVKPEPGEPAPMPVAVAAVAGCAAVLGFVVVASVADPRTVGRAWFFDSAVSA